MASVDTPTRRTLVAETGRRTVVVRPAAGHLRRVLGATSWVLLEELLARSIGNAGLSVTRLWLSSCADGFLECRSQNAAGSVWFNDTQRTSGSRYLSHNQSRRDCFGLPELIKNDL